MPLDVAVRADDAGGAVSFVRADRREFHDVPDALPAREGDDGGLLMGHRDGPRRGQQKQARRAGERRSHRWLILE